MQKTRFSLFVWMTAPTMVAAVSGIASTALLLSNALRPFGAQALFLGTLPVFLLPVVAQILVLWRWAQSVRRPLLYSALAALLIQLAVAGVLRIDKWFDGSLLGMRGSGPLSGLVYWWIGAVITAAIVGFIQARAFYRVLPGRFRIAGVATLSAVGTLLSIIVVLVGFVTIVEAAIPRAPASVIWLILPTGSALAWAIHQFALGRGVLKYLRSIDTIVAPDHGLR